MAADPAAAYDFGLGAGFYVDATEAPFAQHYKMWSYTTVEFSALIAAEFAADMDRQSILGHSMGGHDALTIGLTYPDRYKAVSAFAPIVAPTKVPWGKKALGGDLGTNPRRGVPMTLLPLSKMVRDCRRYWWIKARRINSLLSS